MKCGSHRRCVQLAMFFHSTGGTANLFPCSIYGSKQDANSGVVVVRHMEPHHPGVLTKMAEHGHVPLRITKSDPNYALNLTGKFK